MTKKQIEFYEEALNMAKKEISKTLKDATDKIQSVIEKELQTLYAKNKQQYRNDKAPESKTPKLGGK